MNRTVRWIAIAVALVVVAWAGVELSLWLAIPRTAAESLAAARKVDATQTATIATKQALGELTPEMKARLTDQIEAAYGQIRIRFPGTPEVEEADWRVLEIRDEQSTDPESRIRLAKTFLDQHTSSTRRADLKWRIAELTHRELRKSLDAVSLYEAFAFGHREDPRAPEALFRVGQIYEEIREFAKAVEAYQKVISEFPKSPLADQAQFRRGTLLAERLERKEEAAQAFEAVERGAPPGSRLAQQAGDQRQRLVSEGEKNQQQKARIRYYGGVQEVPAVDRFLATLDAPPFQRLRSQGMDLVETTGSLVLSPEDRSLSATAILRVVAREATATMVLQLGAPLEVRRVEADLGKGFHPVRFSRQDDFVFVDFGSEPVPAATTFALQLDYGGICRDSWGMVAINTSSTMLMGSHVLPTLNLGDARPVSLEVNLPHGYGAVATGRMISEDATSQPDRRILQFRMDLPVFWTGLAVAKYRTFRSDYISTVTGHTIPLAVHLLPGTEEQSARTYLNKLPHILSFYESLLGPFPYDKLDIAQVINLPGGLGTPGVLMLGPPAWQDAEVPAVFLAHEVSHAWFGNLVGLDLSADSPIWLSEGFAEYLDALYHEHVNGPGSLARTMRERAVQYFTMTARIRERALSDLRGNIVAVAPSSYTKGAYVLHMLRGLMGDRAFVELLRKIVARHGGGLLTLSALQSMTEEAAGQDLDWFFDQWVRKTGIPRLEVVDACRVKGEGSTKELAVVIVQKGPRAFRIPLDIQVELEDGKEWNVRLDLRETTCIAVLRTPGNPTRVRLDHQTWVLRHPRFEEWEREVSDDCTTAGMSAVETALIPQPPMFGGELLFWDKTRTAVSPGATKPAQAVPAADLITTGGGIRRDNKNG